MVKSAARFLELISRADISMELLHRIFEDVLVLTPPIKPLMNSSMKKD